MTKLVELRSSNGRVLVRMPEQDFELIRGFDVKAASSPKQCELARRVLSVDLDPVWEVGGGDVLEEAEQAHCDARLLAMHTLVLAAKNREQAASELWANLLNCAAASAKFELMPDSEIAVLVLEHVWAHTPLDSPLNDLLSSVISRLRRSGGGPCVDEDLPTELEERGEKG